MATLVLGIAGRAIAGPIGGIIGTVLGGVVDNAIFGGGGSGRQGARLGNLTVQSAAYGEPILHIHGRMRVAGNLVWTAGIRETSSTSGGGKGRSSSTSYSYSSSFAVLLCGRTIAGVGRIWADGKLLRDASGAWLSPVTMRLFTGDELQAADPLIAAAESGGTPAYRGAAYVVFEDLPLADYGNRIPNLTFELIADDGPIDAGTAMRALGVTTEGDFPALTGHAAAVAGSLRTALEPLLTLSGAAFDGEALTVRGDGIAAQALAADDFDTGVFGAANPPEQQRRAAADTLPDVLQIGYFDIDRDYQAGLQRAVRGSPSGRTEHRDVAVAFDALGAKAAAAGALARASAARATRAVRLPWRHLGVAAGAMVAVDGQLWRVRERRFEGFVVTLELEARDGAAAVALTADAGRVLAFGDSAPGATTLLAFELPPLPGALPSGPQIWIAAAGASPGWRRAGIEASNDGGASYAAAGTVEGGAVIGTATTVLAAGPRDRWDFYSSVEVTLLNDAMWLEGRSADSVLAGANLALIGDELVQFASAEAIAPRRFRLRQLLRGRRGTEVAMAGHSAGERFVLIDTARLLSLDVPADRIGGTVIVRATGAGDAEPVAVSLTVTGRALQPLSPAALTLVADGSGGVAASWIRRSRAGFGWLDFADAPLGEEGEAYRVSVSLDGRAVRSDTVSAPAYAYTAAMRSADGGGVALTLTVAQISALTGPGSGSAATL